MAALQERYLYGTGGYYSYSSPWNRYGRWILLGVIVFVGLLCLAAIAFTRVRRQRGHQQQVQSYPQDYSQQYNNQQYQQYQQYQGDGGPQPHYDNYPAASGYNANYDSNQHQPSNYQYNSESKADYNPNSGSDNFQPPPGPPPTSYQRN